MTSMAERVPAQVEVEDRPCPLGCAQDDELVLMAEDRLHGLPGRYPVVKCRSCGQIPRTVARSPVRSKYAPASATKSGVASMLP